MLSVSSSSSELEEVDELDELRQSEPNMSDQSSVVVLSESEVVVVEESELELLDAMVTDTVLTKSGAAVAINSSCTGRPARAKARCVIFLRRKSLLRRAVW
jgi:hypothetical protein